MELFNFNFLKDHIYISDTDRRVMASDEASFTIEEMTDKELVDRAGLEDEYEEADEENDVDKMEKIKRKAEDIVSEEISDEWEKGLKNPIEFLVDEKGMFTKEELMKQSFIQIDVEDAAEDSVQKDGIDYFLDQHDGLYEEIEDPETGKEFLAFG